MAELHSYKVEGMTCGNCALTIHNYLEKNGASDIVANATTGELHFTPKEEAETENLLAGLAKLGYKTFDQDPQVLDSHAEHGHSISLEKTYLLISLFFWIPLIAHMFIRWAPLHNPLVQLLLCIPSYIICILYFGKSAVRSLRNGLPNMDVLVFLGASAAFIYSIIGWQMHPEDAHNYLFFETCASIVTLVLLGNYLEALSVKTTAASLTELMKLQKTKAKIVFTDSIGKETIMQVPNTEVKVDDIVQLNTGDQVPVDGRIISGTADLDESMMTGESLPAHKSINDHVVGGTVVVNGNLRIQTTQIGAQTALSQIINLVNKAQSTKPPMQKLADKISAVFVPIVVAIAVLTFLINYYAGHHSLADSMMRTIAVMVIACPCAMGLATPAAVMVGMGRAARNGILVKGGDTLQKFTRLKHIVFDKTGTLTTGKLEIADFQILDNTISEQAFKALVVGIENHSSHPIAQSISKHWSGNQVIDMHQIEEIKGVGLKAKNQQEDTIEIGSYRLAQKMTTERHDLFVVKNGQLIGWIDIQDEIRPEANLVIKSLRAKNYQLAILSGDRKEKVEAVAHKLNIKTVYAEKLPQEKLDIIEQLSTDGGVAMVGDGINDSPALAKADIGISLSDATHIAMQTANVILSKNTLESLPEAIGLGKHTFLTIKQNLFWAFLYNVVALPVAAFGLLTPTIGAGVMALSDIVLVANSLRLRYKKVD